MSLMLPRGYYTNASSGARNDQGNSEPPPKFTRPVPGGTQDKRCDPTDTDQETDPEVGHEKALKNAQSQWAQRRRDGYEDYGAEMGKEARVWHTYVKETDRIDNELVEGWNKSLDVLLSGAVFGYFDCVRFMLPSPSTHPTRTNIASVKFRFVIVSSEGLQQDPTDTSTQTLLIISQTLLAISYGQPANASTIEGPPTTFKPTRSALLVNTLWYFSLSLSVAVSLVAMLAKEWCYSFMANRSGQMYEQGRRRQERWNGILRWKMMDVIAFLPMVMHSALFLFALGLCVYLWSICIPVALPVIITTCIAMIVYFSTTVLPLWFTFCPYTTASSKLLQSYLGVIGKSINLVLDHMSDPPERPPLGIRDGYNQWKRMRHWAVASMDRILKSWADALRPSQAHTESVLIVDPKELMENGKVPMDTLTSDMLAWLLANSEDSRVTTITLQSLAGADPWLPRLPLLQSGVISLLRQRLEGCLELDIQRNEYRLRDLAPIHSASLCFRGLSYLLSFHDGEGFYLDYRYPHFWSGYRTHQETDNLSEVVSKNTWNLDIDIANIGSLLTTGTHGSKFKFSMDYTKIPDLILFGNIRPQAVIYRIAFNFRFDPPRYVDRIVRQTEILATFQQYIDGRIVLHTHSIIAIIRHETELLCARYPFLDQLSSADQFTFPIILAKLLCLPSIRRHPEVSHTIGIALMVSAFEFGRYPVRDNQPRSPGSASSRSTQAASYHYRPKVFMDQSHVYSSLEASKLKETEALLVFGLFALLEQPSVYSLCDVDVMARLAIEDVGRNHSPSNPIAYTHIHTLPESFTYPNHMRRVMDQISCTTRGDPVRNEVAKLRCARALHDIECTSDRCGHYVEHLQQWCRAEYTECRAIFLDMMAAKPFQVNPQELRDLVLEENALVELSSALQITDDAQDALNLMEQIWNLVVWIYRHEGKPVWECLRSIMSEGLPEIPDSILRMGLAEKWFPKLHYLCAASPQVVFQSKVLRCILRRLEIEWGSYQRWRYGRWGAADRPADIVERAAERYRRYPNRFTPGTSADLIHKIALDCVTSCEQQNGFTSLQPSLSTQPPRGTILQKMQASITQQQVFAAIGAEMC